MDIKSILPVIEKVLVWVSLKRVMTISITAIVVIISLTIFENRTQLASIVKDGNSERTVSDEPFEISASNDVLIKDFVKKNPDIGLATIFSVNMRVLQRQPVYFYTGDTVMKELIDTFAQNKKTAQPFFTQEDKNDTQMIGLINGEFQCVKFEDTVNSLILPSIRAKIKTVCRVGLPPYQGQFSGYLSILLFSVPSSHQQQEYRLEMVKLATMIYMSDVVGKQANRSKQLH